MVPVRWCLLAFKPSSWVVEKLTTFIEIFPSSCSGSYLRFLPPVQVPKPYLRFPNGALKSLKVYDPHHGRKF